MLNIIKLFIIVVKSALDFKREIIQNSQQFLTNSEFAKLSKQEKEKYIQFLVDNNIEFQQSDSGYTASFKVQNKENVDPIRKSIEQIKRASFNYKTPTRPVFPLRRKFTREDAINLIQEIYSKKFEDVSNQLKQKNVVNEDFGVFVMRFAQNNQSCLTIITISNRNQQKIRKIIVFTIINENQVDEVQELLEYFRNNFENNKISAFNFMAQALEKYNNDSKPQDKKILINEQVINKLQKFFYQEFVQYTEQLFNEVKMIRQKNLDKMSKDYKTIRYLEGLQKQFKTLSGCKEDIKLYNRMVLQIPRLSRCFGKLLE